MIDSGEDCDDGLTGGNTDQCTDGTADGHPDGIPTVACEITFCGDKIIQSLNGRGVAEECDDGMHCDDGSTCMIDSDCIMGDLKCKPRPGKGCDERCQGASVGIRISSFVFNPNVLALGEDVTDFSIFIDSTEIGDADIFVTVKDAGDVPDPIKWPSNPLIPHLTHPLSIGVEEVDLAGSTDFSSMGLEEGGSYKVEVRVELVSNTLINDSQTEFFTVKSTPTGGTPIIVPEINLFLLSFIALLVLGLLLKKN